jgi:hypothetical protein
MPHMKSLPPAAYRGFKRFTLIYSGKERPWKVCGSRFNEKRPSVRPRSLLSGNGQKSALRLFTVTLGRVFKLTQPILCDLPLGNKFVLEDGSHLLAQDE